jgi:hypothetical protein
MIVFVGMETSGTIRRAFQAAGHETYSCDLLPSQDGGEELAFSPEGLPLGRHLVGDIFEVLDNLWANDLWPDLGIFHPDCTYLTASAEWAYKDPDFDRYPGVGYHQKLKPGTLFGAARREARAQSVEMVRKIWALKIRRKAIENPIGHLSTAFRKPTQIVQPNWFGDDASKATCLWLDGLMPLEPTKIIPPTLRSNGKSYWANQTDTGQNRLSPSADRWQDRADTYPGIAAAMVKYWG